MPESFEGAAVCVDLWSLMACSSFYVCVGLKQTWIHSRLFIFAANQYCIFVHNERVCLIDDVKSHISFPYTFRVANMTACWYCDLMCYKNES